MTLKGHYALSIKRRVSFGAHHENLNEDRLYCQQWWCSAMTLDSGNIRFVGLFPGVPWRGGVKRQWGNQKCRFWMLRLRHLRKWDQHYYIDSNSPLLPFHWQQNTWPWMATLRSIFNFHYYEPCFGNYVMYTYCWAIYKIFFLWRPHLTSQGPSPHASHQQTWQREVKLRSCRILQLRERVADLS